MSKSPSSRRRHAFFSAAVANAQEGIRPRAGKELSAYTKRSHMTSRIGSAPSTPTSF